jgi:hypothetical protein
VQEHFAVRALYLPVLNLAVRPRPSYVSAGPLRSRLRQPRLADLPVDPSKFARESTIRNLAGVPREDCPDAGLGKGTTILAEMGAPTLRRRPSTWA